MSHVAAELVVGLEIDQEAIIFLFFVIRVRPLVGDTVLITATGVQERWFEQTASGRMHAAGPVRKVDLRIQVQAHRWSVALHTDSMDCRGQYGHTEVVFSMTESPSKGLLVTSLRGKNSQ